MLNTQLVGFQTAKTPSVAGTESEHTRPAPRESPSGLQLLPEGNQISELEPSR